MIPFISVHVYFCLTNFGSNLSLPKYFNVVASRWALLVSGQPVLGQVEGPLLFCLPLGGTKGLTAGCYPGLMSLQPLLHSSPHGHKKQQWVWEPPQWEPKPVLWTVLPSPTLSALPLPFPLGEGREMACRLKSKHPLFPSPGKKNWNFCPIWRWRYEKEKKLLTAGMTFPSSLCSRIKKHFVLWFFCWQSLSREKSLGK